MDDRLVVVAARRRSVEQGEVVARPAPEALVHRVDRRSRAHESAHRPEIDQRELVNLRSSGDPDPLRFDDDTGVWHVQRIARLRVERETLVSHQIRVRRAEQSSSAMNDESVGVSTE